MDDVDFFFFLGTCEISFDLIDARLWFVKKKCLCWSIERCYGRWVLCLSVSGCWDQGEGSCSVQ